QEKIKSLIFSGKLSKDDKSLLNNNKFWSYDELKKLIELCEQNNPPREISKILGRSAGSVSSQLYTLRRQGKIAGKKSKELTI
ncbi:MAG: hypothetical protein AAB432_03210, partial [Patescibacteria group bacterium]